jgi:hypothetical protein
MFPVYRPVFVLFHKKKHVSFKSSCFRFPSDKEITYVVIQNNTAVHHAVTINITS